MVPKRSSGSTQWVHGMLAPQLNPSTPSTSTQSSPGYQSASEPPPMTDGAHTHFTFAACSAEKMSCSRRQAFTYLVTGVPPVGVHGYQSPLNSWANRMYAVAP